MNALIVDIGSNSIRAMEVETAESGFAFFDKRVFTTRLAEGLLGSGRLSDARMRQSLEVLTQLKSEADAAGMPLYAYATSAVRDAENRDTFLAAALSAGVRIDVLSGEEEAGNALLGAAGDGTGLIDIGGGSTQIVTADFAQSFPLGCVRAHDACGETDDLGALYAALLPVCLQYIPLPPVSAARWVGVGGTVTTLAAMCLGLTGYDRRSVGACSLSQSDIRMVLYNIAALGGTRRLHPLLAERHDVILAGGVILMYVMEGLSIPRIRVSDADGMEGYAKQVLKK